METPRISNVFERLYSQTTFAFRMHCQVKPDEPSAITKCHPERHSLFRSPTLYKPTVAFTRSTIAYQQERKRVMETETSSNPWNTPPRKTLSRGPGTPATMPSSTPRPAPAARRVTPPTTTTTTTTTRPCVVPQPQEAPVIDDFEKLSQPNEIIEIQDETQKNHAPSANKAEKDDDRITQRILQQGDIEDDLDDLLATERSDDDV